MKLFFMISTFVLSSCVQSLVYNPSMNLSSPRSRPGAVQVYGGWSRLAETRPRKVKEDTAPGVNGGVRVDVSERLNCFLNVWGALEDLNEAHRGGASLGMIVTLSNDTSAMTTAILARGGVAWAGGRSSFAGGGGTVSFVAWFPLESGIDPYLAAGPLLGFTDVEDPTYGEKWGWGIIFNLGLDARVASRLHVNAEVAGVYQDNKYDKRTDMLFIPSIGITAIF